MKEKMIRIIHLSDIHLSKDNVKDFKTFTIEALKKDLKKYNDEANIDLIVFSGDLINKGGQSYPNINEAFADFDEKIIKPITDEIELSKELFFFAPGNHDIDTEADDRIDENGLRTTLINTGEVNKYIDSGDTERIKRILPYKEFERKFYESYPQKHEITNYQSCFKAGIKDHTVGITCFNSSWRCYDSETDKGKIILGERQVTNAREIIANCDVKIAIMHHPFDWLADFERENIRNFIKKDYDLLFCGHVHKGNAWTKSDMYGNLFVSVAPSDSPDNLRGNDRVYANGYSIVDLTEMEITTHHRRYVHNKECFVPNNDLGDDDGLSFFDTPISIQKRLEKPDWEEEFKKAKKAFKDNKNKPVFVVYKDVAYFKQVMKEFQRYFQESTDNFHIALNMSFIKEALKKCKSELDEDISGNKKREKLANVLLLEITQQIGEQLIEKTTVNNQLSAVFDNLENGWNSRAGWAGEILSPKSKFLDFFESILFSIFKEIAEKHQTIIISFQNFEGVIEWDREIGNSILTCFLNRDDIKADIRFVIFSQNNDELRLSPSSEEKEFLTNRVFSYKLPGLESIGNTNKKKLHLKLNLENSII